ncbi:MAG: winged helix DNA-binding domain-containing protein [Thaumarchaeota archaeon]|nr:winged helix DNA-binding domain-containing protein [Nitrososphaerota archaeon]
MSPRAGIVTSRESARRLSIVKQHLADESRTKHDAARILQVIRDIGCLQLDPISAVAPSHQTVLWSRLGSYALSELDKLLWKEKKLFEFWAHRASIVLTEDYPLYYPMMKNWPDDAPISPLWGARVKEWVRENAKVKQYILDELKRGPRLSRQFEKPRMNKHTMGWSSSSDVSRMLTYLFFRGDIMVVGRQGIQKVWGLTEEFLPAWTEKGDLTEEEVEHHAVQRAIKALGMATKANIRFHFLRGRYPNLVGTLQRLEDESKVERVQVEGEKEQYYVHSDDLKLLDRIESGRWRPRTTLLSPFDNLICDRDRTDALFGFHYRIGIYTPKHKRTHGYYVLPILQGDRLIGRVDPVMDRRGKRLVVNAVHAEKGAPHDRQAADEVARAIEDLGGFLGAKEVVYPSRVPDFWKGSLR